MIEITNLSCGAVLLSHEPTTPHTVVARLWEHMYGLNGRDKCSQSHTSYTVGDTVNIGQKAIAVFSGVTAPSNKEYKTLWIEKLLEFIEKEKLGVVVQSPPTLNLRYGKGAEYGHMISVWCWVMDHPQIAKWYTAYKGKEAEAKQPTAAVVAAGVVAMPGLRPAGQAIYGGLGGTAGVANQQSGNYYHGADLFF